MRFGERRCGVVVLCCCGVVWCGVVWCDVAWRGVMSHGVAWRGVVWCGVAVWCGVVCSTHASCSEAISGSAEWACNELHTPPTHKNYAHHTEQPRTNLAVVVAIYGIPFGIHGCIDLLLLGTCGLARHVQTTKGAIVAQRNCSSVNISMAQRAAG